MCALFFALPFACWDSLASSGEPPLETPKVGAEQLLRVGERAQDVVVAREIHWPGRSFTSRLLFSTNTHEALIASSSANRLCMLKGRLYKVTPGSQSFLITPSSPLGGQTLTADKALEFCQRATHGQPGAKWVDLRPLLEGERRATRLAGSLLLQDLRLRPEETNLVVDFESFTKLKGTVRLDSDLNVLSMGLNGAPGDK